MSCCLWTSISLGPALHFNGKISQHGGALGTHGCETEVLPDITKWNGREEQRNTFLPDTQRYWRAAGLSRLLALGHSPWVIILALPVLLRSRKCGLSPLPPSGPPCHPVLWPHHGPHHASISSQHSTPLSHRSPFSWFWHCLPAFQTVLPIHTHLEFLPLPFVCLLVQQRVQSQLDTPSRKDRETP